MYSTFCRLLSFFNCTSFRPGHTSDVIMFTYSIVSRNDFLSDRSLNCSPITSIIGSKYFYFAFLTYYFSSSTMLLSVSFICKFFTKLYFLLTFSHNVIHNVKQLTNFHLKIKIHGYLSISAFERINHTSNRYVPLKIVPCKSSNLNSPAYSSRRGPKYYNFTGS